jgi:hypothetical protein
VRDFLPSNQLDRFVSRFVVLQLTLLRPHPFSKDNPHEAAVQGQVALDLCWRLERCQDLQLEAAEILDDFQREREQYTAIKVLYQICYL